MIVEFHRFDLLIKNDVVAQAFKERVIKEGPWEEDHNADNMWMKMEICIRKVALEEFRVSRGSRREAKDT
jgi:hypothetical protein